MRLALPPDFDLAWTLGFLAARTVPSMEAVTEGKEYRRSLRTGGRAVTLELRRRGSALEARTAPELPRDEPASPSRRARVTAPEPTTSRDPETEAGGTPEATR